MAQKTAYRPTPTNPTTPTAPQPTSQAASDGTNDLLDEIDSILTEEEAFAANYRQRGGQ